MKRMALQLSCQNEGDSGTEQNFGTPIVHSPKLLEGTSNWGRKNREMTVPGEKKMPLMGFGSSHKALS